MDSILLPKRPDYKLKKILKRFWDWPLPPHPPRVFLYEQFVVIWYIIAHMVDYKI